MYITVVMDSQHTYVLQPVFERDAIAVALSNQYDGSYSAYLQSQLDKELIAQKYPQLRDMEPWDCQVIEMDGHTFRHTVGGQSD